MRWLKGGYTSQKINENFCKNKWERDPLFFKQSQRLKPKQVKLTQLWKEYKESECEDRKIEISKLIKRLK